MEAWRVKNSRNVVVPGSAFQTGVITGAGLGSEARAGDATGVGTTGETTAGLVLDDVESNFAVSSFFGGCATGAGGNAVVGARIDFAVGAGAPEDFTGDGSADNGAVWAAAEGFDMGAEATGLFTETGTPVANTEGLLSVAVGESVVRVGTGKGWLSGFNMPDFVCAPGFVKGFPEVRGGTEMADLTGEVDNDAEAAGANERYSSRRAKQTSRFTSSTRSRHAGPATICNASLRRTGPILRWTPGKGRPSSSENVDDVEGHNE